MVITIINGLLDAAYESGSQLKPFMVNAMFKSILPTLAENFSLKVLYGDQDFTSIVGKRVKIMDGTATSPTTLMANEEDGRNLARFLINLQNLVKKNEEFDEYLNVVATRIIRTTEALSPGYWDIFYFPFLEELMRLLSKSDIEIDGFQYEWIFESCLGNYIKYYVCSRNTTSYELRLAHAGKHIQSLGVEELKNYLPNNYGAIIHWMLPIYRLRMACSMLVFTTRHPWMSLSWRRLRQKLQGHRTR